MSRLLVIQDLNSFRTGWKSRCWRTNTKDNWPLYGEWLRPVVFHGISRLGSGKAVKARPLQAAPYPSRKILVVPANRSLWLLIHRHLVLPLEMSWDLLHWYHCYYHRQGQFRFQKESTKEPLACLLPIVKHRWLATRPPHWLQGLCSASGVKVRPI